MLVGETFHLRANSAAVAPFLYSAAISAHEASESRNHVGGASGCDLLMATRIRPFWAPGTELGAWRER